MPSAGTANNGQTVRLRNLTRSEFYFEDIEVEGADERLNFVLGDKDGKPELGEHKSEKTLEPMEWAALLASERYGAFVQGLLDNGDLTKYIG